MMRFFDNQYLKWWAILPGWILGDVVGAAAAYLLVQEITNKTSITNLDFEIALLRVCTYVILADGVVEKSERYAVRDFFKKTFGSAKAEKIFKEVKTSRLKDFSLRELAIVIGNRKNSTTHYSIFQFLYKLSASDGVIDSREDSVIREFATHLGFNEGTLGAIRSSFISSRSRTKKFDHVTMGHLAILGLDEKATIQDVKSAYRKLSKEFHPDMLGDMSQAFKDLAKEKYLDIQNSYEYLMKNL